MRGNLVKLSSGRVKSFKYGDFEELKNFVTTNPGKSARICIHNGNDDLLHQMIIVHRRGNYIRPHKHEFKSESFQLIEGALVVFIFNDNGEVIDKINMSVNENIVFRIERNIWHTIVPTSELVVFHEITNGPFTGNNDSIFPDWAPQCGEHNKIDMFMKNLN
ncbi:MAG: WbuC family cupin fold metalloprotein [Clostridia bacterium]|nr:WbuC family cupin fold metalloprotein [Clostridia bacterium]